MGKLTDVIRVPIQVLVCFECVVGTAYGGYTHEYWWDFHFRGHRTDSSSAGIYCARVDGAYFQSWLEVRMVALPRQLSVMKLPVKCF